MIPPMNDLIVYKLPRTDESGEIVKDDQGFQETIDIETNCRITDGSNLAITQDGRTRNSLFTVCLPSNITPNIDDEVVIDGQTMSVLKVKARKNWAGTHVYYWVIDCGQ